jgi:hypothetical protein
MADGAPDELDLDVDGTRSKAKSIGRPKVDRTASRASIADHGILRS